MARLLVEKGVEYGMKQCRTDQGVLGMVMDGKVKLIMAVRVDGIMIEGSDETFKDFQTALIVKFHTHQPWTTNLVHLLRL